MDCAEQSTRRSVLKTIRDLPLSTRALGMRYPLKTRDELPGLLARMEAEGLVHFQAGLWHDGPAEQN